MPHVGKTKTNILSDDSSIKRKMHPMKNKKFLDDIVKHTTAFDKNK